MREAAPGPHPECMGNELAAISNQIAGVVEKVGRSVVAVHARHRWASSGVVWRPGVVVTAQHTVRRYEEITVTLPDGATAPATLAGADPGTDIAVLRVEGAAVPVERAASVPAAGNLALTIGRSPDS